ncbi:hypothetical protein D3C84_1174130 [compost metagenome]
MLIALNPFVIRLEQIDVDNTVRQTIEAGLHPINALLKNIVRINRRIVLQLQPFRLKRIDHLLQGERFFRTRIGAAAC